MNKKRILRTLMILILAIGAVVLGNLLTMALLWELDLDFWLR